MARQADNCFYPVLIGATIGARLWYGLFNLDLYGRNLGLFIALRVSDFAWPGALLGGALAGYLWCRWNQFDELKLADSAALALPVVQALASIGLLLSGEAFGLPVWPDEMQGYAGPLAGIQAGLIHCTTDYMVTAPCDSPFLPADLVARLSQALLDNHADVAVAVTGVGEQRQVHPVFCLMKSSLIQHLTEYLRGGSRKVDAWYASLDRTEVHFEDEAAFRNINTIAELKAFEPATGQQ